MLAKHIEHSTLVTTNATDNDPKKKLTPTVTTDADEEGKVSNLSCRQQHKCSIVNCGKEFKLKTHLARHYAQAHGIAFSSNSPRPIMKTRTAFYLHTNPLTRLSRILCRSLINPRRAARQTSYAINTQLVKQEFSNRILGQSLHDIKSLIRLGKKDRGSVTKVANRLGSPGMGPYEWLILTPREKIPKPEVISFPKPPKGPDGSLLYERVPNKIIDVDEELSLIPTSVPGTTIQTIRKRVPEKQQLNGTDVTKMPTGPPPKRPNKDPMPSHCPSPEQFAAMMAASGQPLTRYHVSIKTIKTA